MVVHRSGIGISEVWFPILVLAFQSLIPSCGVGILSFDSKWLCGVGILGFDPSGAVGILKFRSQLWYNFKV